MEDNDAIFFVQINLKQFSYIFTVIVKKGTRKILYTIQN